MRNLAKGIFLKIAKISINRKIAVLVSLLFIISSLLYLLYVVFLPKKIPLSTNTQKTNEIKQDSKILNKSAKVLFKNGIILSSPDSDFFRFNLVKSENENIVVLNSLKEVDGGKNYEILNSTEIQSSELYKDLDEFQLYGLSKLSDKYLFIVLSPQKYNDRDSYKVYNLNKSTLLSTYSAKFQANYYGETSFYFSQKDGILKILNEESLVTGKCLVQTTINFSTNKISTKKLPCGYKKILEQQLNYYFTFYNKSKYELIKYNFETEQLQSLYNFESLVYPAKLNLKDGEYSSSDFLIEELNTAEPLKDVNVFAVREQITKTDLAQVPLENFDVGDWYNGFTVNYLGVDKTGVSLVGEILDKKYNFTTDKDTSPKRELIVDSSNFPDLYENLNFLLNISRLRPANTGGGGGPFTGVHISFIEQPKNNLEVILFYVDYSKFSSPNYDSKSLMAFQKFLYDKEKNLIFKSDLKNFYFDRKPSVYSGLSFYKYSPDLSSAILVDSGGDACGGGSTYYYFEGEKIVSDKEFMFGCGGGNNVYKDSNDLMYYGNSVSLYESKIEFTDTDYTIFSSYLKEKNLENYGVNTFNTYTNIRKYNILTQDDVLLLSFDKYKTNSSDLVLVLSWEGELDETDSNTLKFIIFNTTEKKIRKLINYNILSGEVVLD